MDNRFSLKRMRLWRLIPLLLHWICVVYLLAMLPAQETTAFAERKWEIPDVWRRDEICTAVWLTASHPISLCKKDDEEISPYDLPPGTKVWAYLRHSPGDDQTVESQQAAVEKLVREKGWILDEVFCDQWSSGSTTKSRGEFNLLRSVL